MKTIQQLLIRTLLTLAFCFLILIFCKGQSKNQFSVTPIKLISQKINLQFERDVFKNWAGVLDVQFWFIDRRGDSFLEYKKQEDTNIKNNGIRYSLGMKRYFDKEKKISSNDQFYFGFNFFTGNHSIEQKKIGNETTIFGLALNSLSKSGAINLRSSGVNINLGIKTVFSNKVLMDFGVLIGRSWTNISEDSFLLYDVDPTISPKEVKFDKKINGVFFEPRFAVGYSF